MSDARSGRVRVLLVDDQELVRTGLRGILRARFGFEIVGELDSGEGVVEAVAELAPDVVVMDVRMPRRRRRRPRPGCCAARPDAPPVLVLTTFEDEEILAGALRAGAAGFLLKGVPAEDLQRAVRAVAAGESWLDPAVTGRVLSAYRDGPTPALPGPEVDVLTPREREVLALIGAGLSNTEIAAALTLGEGTIKTHIGHIFAKLDLRDRAAAVVFAFDHGLVQPGRPLSPSYLTTSSERSLTRVSDGRGSEVEEGAGAADVGVGLRLVRLAAARPASASPPRPRARPRARPRGSSSGSASGSSSASGSGSGSGSGSARLGRLGLGADSRCRTASRPQVGSWRGRFLLWAGSGSFSSRLGLLAARLGLRLGLRRLGLGLGLDVEQRVRSGRPSPQASARARPSPPPPARSARPSARLWRRLGLESKREPPARLRLCSASASAASAPRPSARPWPRARPP